MIYGIGNSTGPGAVYQRVQRETVPVQDKDAAKSAESPRQEPPAIDWAYETGQYLADLKGRYDGVAVITGNFEKNDAFSLMNGLASGRFLFISQDFMKAMGKNAESFQQGKALLEEYAARLASPLGLHTAARGVLLTDKEAVEWQTEKAPKAPPAGQFGQQDQTTSLIEKMQKAQEEAQKRKTRLKVKNKTHLLNSATRVYSKLSRAPAQMQVRSVISSAGYSLYQVKQAMANCDNDERQQYQAIAGQLQRAIARARTKIQDLDNEQALKRRQDRAVRDKSLRRARQAEYALKKRKSARLSKENAYLRQSALESYLIGEQARQAQLAQYRGERMAEQAEAASGVQTDIPAAGGTDFSAGGAVMPGSFTISTGAAVTVSVAPFSLG